MRMKDFYSELFIIYLKKMRMQTTSSRRDTSHPLKFCFEAKFFGLVHRMCMQEKDFWILIFRHFIIFLEIFKFLMVRFALYFKNFFFNQS